MRPIFSLLIIVMAISSLTAQIQQPASPKGQLKLQKGADLIYLLPPPDTLEIEASLARASSAHAKSMPFALLRDVQLEPAFHGGWEYLEDMRIWRVHLISPSALSLGLIFDRFHLEEGVNLLIYTPGMEHIKGAFTSLNNKDWGGLAVGHIPGDELILELQVPESLGDFGELRLGRISHGFRQTGQKGGFYCTGFGCAGDCNIDINCIEGSNWQREKHAVVRLNTPQQYCSGVLINNSYYNGDPLVLTAKHCIAGNDTANNTVFEFNYESPACFGPNGSLAQSVSGAEVLAVGDSVDFCLVRLSQHPPLSYEAYYAGWKLGETAPGPGTAIHHPWADVKKISRDEDALSIPESADEIVGEFRRYYHYSFWKVSRWDSGTTEPGSSGSPLFNPAKQVVGVLSWGFASCGDSIGYDEESGRVIYDKEDNVLDYYSRMNVAWDAESNPAQSLYQWLDPAGTGLTELGGFKPVSVKEAEPLSTSKYRVWPNPARAILHLAPQEGGAAPESISLLDMNGRLLREWSPGRGTQTLELSGLAPGLYLLRIEGRSGSGLHKIIIGL